ncbi:MucBP domain-containing protein [Pseudoramibacter sp. HA2172]|uniref:MucBP domain-containing protein n=1 Tax=Pseudoramibacter faecis TaxID=3108534 RepID=UPI002E781043|nr:MucBP domain-containing protein [Pseudoramibacter sp. HA2172]
MGDTRAGTRLDLLYIVTETDAAWWQAHSDYAGAFRVHGIAFTGEPYLKNTTNNAIVVLYNGANRVSIHYRIVREGTNTEVPVLVSFIATDIDVSQGVKTNLHNLAHLIPKGTHLREAGGVIYDQSSDAQNPYGKDLNGAADLPAGGYLGVCFNSHFDYTFYAPAPANAGVYRTASGVRYDLFGSALQAKVAVDRQTHLTVRSQDDSGKALKPEQELKSLNTFAASPAAPKIPKFRLTKTQTQTPAPDEKRLTYTYTPETTLTIRAVDQASGKLLAPARTLTLLKGQRYRIAPPAIRGYRPPKGQTVIAAADQTVTLGYRKITPSKQTNRPQTRRAASTKRSAPKRTAAASRPQAKPAGPAAPKPKKGKAKKKIDWFEKNTGIKKDGKDQRGKKINEQKVFFDVLKAIEQDGKKHHKSAAEIKRDQFYFMGAVNYGGGNLPSIPQIITSRVGSKNYSRASLANIAGKKNSKDFYKLLRNSHKIDFSHMGIAAAGALDRSNRAKFPQSFMTAPLSPLRFMNFPGIIINETVSHGLVNFFYHKVGNKLMPKRTFQYEINHWVVLNGYYGDWVTEHGHINKADLNTDLDLYNIIHSKKPLRTTLKKYYNRPNTKQKPLLKKSRSKAKRNLSETHKAIRLTTSLAMLALAGWGIIRSVKKKLSNGKKTIGKLFHRLFKRKKSKKSKRKRRSSKPRLKKSKHYKKRKFKKARIKSKTHHKTNHRLKRGNHHAKKQKAKKKPR